MRFSEVEPLWHELKRAAFALTRNHADAEDVVQTAFMRALEHAKAHSSDPHMRRWLRTVIRHLVIDRARRDRRFRWCQGYDVASVVAPEPESEPGWAHVTSDALRDAVSACDMLFREVFRMYYEEGLSYAEIARSLDVPLGTVSTRMLRARQQIRRALEAGFVPLARGADRVTAKTIHWEEIAGPAFFEGQTKTPAMQYEKGTAMKIKKIEQSKDSKKDGKQPAGVQVKTDIKAGAAALVAVCG